MLNECNAALNRKVKVFLRTAVYWIRVSKELPH